MPTTAAVATLVAASFARCALFPATDELMGRDAGSSDAHVVDGPEAAPPGDARPSRYCEQLSPKPKFCDDFDDVALGAWTATETNAGGTVTRDSTNARSAPNALVTMTPGAAIQQARVRYRITAPKVVHVAYDIRVDVRGTYVELGYVRFVTGASMRSQVYLRARGLPSPAAVTTEAPLSDGGLAVHDVSLAGMPTFADWTRVAIDIDVAATPPSLTVSINGTIAGSQVLEASRYYPTDFVDVEVGTGYTDKASTEWRVRYDNATIDWQ